MAGPNSLIPSHIFPSLKVGKTNHLTKKPIIKMKWIVAYLRSFDLSWKKVNASSTFFRFNDKSLKFEHRRRARRDRQEIAIQVELNFAVSCYLSLRTM